MIPLIDKTNVNPVSGAYPFGSLRDNPGDGTGTPVNTMLIGDIIQTFEKIMADSGITPNGQPDNETNGWQLFNAMKTTMVPFKEWIGFLNCAGSAVTPQPFIDSLQPEPGYPFGFDSTDQSLLTCMWYDPTYVGTDITQYDIEFQLMWMAHSSTTTQQNVLVRLESFTASTPLPGLVTAQIRFFKPDGTNQTINAHQAKLRIAIRRKY